MPDSSRTYLKRLRGQMFLVLLGFGLVPMVTVSFLSLSANLDEIEVRTRNVLEAMVKNRKVTVELFLEEKLRELELVIEFLPVEELSRVPVLDSLLVNMRREEGGIVDLGLIGEDGRHVAYVGPYNLHERDYSEQPWFAQVMVQGRYESDVFLGFRQFPHMVMAVRKRKDARNYVLRATLDTDLLSRLVREGGIESGADVFILNRKGEYQTQYSDGHRLMEKAEVETLPVHSGVRIVEMKRIDRTEFVATTWLEGDNWALVARQEVPGFTEMVVAHPELLWVVLFWFGMVPILGLFITRRRLQQVRKLEAKNAALLESVAHAQKMAAIGRLASSIAHEINNPLAIIQAQVGVMSDVLAEDADFSEAEGFKDRLKKIDAQVERGRKVTHRLLGFSRRVGPELEPVDVAAALEETIGFIEKELLATRVSIVRNYTEDVPLIRTNLSQMQQVFLNLINNAVDAIEHEGEIRLLVCKVDDGVEVHVSDSGPGIPEQDLDKVFEPFFSTKSGKEAHSGLGLAISAEIVKNLGGRIDVESKPDEGTTFRMWFPLDSELS